MKTCGVEGCGIEAEYWFHNRVSGIKGFKCGMHARGLANRGHTFEQMLDNGTLKAPQDAPSHLTAGLQCG